ncbi:AhpC/TSA family protein [Thermosporothrix hazakensis]|uniref:AhpC/TSA family protein n=2 Tax=Thermosporothrix TaxID=768650 RepID=A0A326U6P1_THEHA|nr:redoxin domain-containing protein [Thermosporothrix hazakensis]PZW30473.1 AhpC/TSA family protein [Thermosporothrix hazakensis]BBH91188.1 hypothetical protein KTC_59390 [Thermosporothrix sp. COM3]GCE49333.1 hypothetical protein KTH_42020 [Thermosporothrix hazakensis]
MPQAPALEQGQIIPIFTLPGTDGMPHSPWDYKQHENLLLLILQSSRTPEEQTVLQAYAQHYAAIREERCAILSITADPVITNLHTQETLHLPFPLLSDPQGTVIERYTSWKNETHELRPCLVLADRYNALVTHTPVETVADLPPISDLLATLQYINCLCTP